MELITPSYQNFWIKEQEWKTFLSNEFFQVNEKILEQYHLQIPELFYSLADKEELWNDQLPSGEVAVLVLKRNMFVLLPHNLQFGSFMPERQN